MSRKLLTTCYLILNVFFSIIIVLLNKWLYVQIEFPNMTLSMIHFVITFLGLIICEQFDVFCIKNVPLKEMIDQGGLVGNPDATPNLPKQHLNRRQMKRSKSVIQTILFGSDNSEDDAKCKNIRQTGKKFISSIFSILKNK